MAVYNINSLSIGQVPILKNYRASLHAQPNCQKYRTEKAREHHIAAFDDYVEETLHIIRDLVMCVVSNNGGMQINYSSTWRYNTDLK